MERECPKRRAFMRYGNGWEEEAMKKRKREYTGKWAEWKNRAWLYFNIGWTILYLLWRIFYTVPVEYGILSAVAGIVLLAVEVLGMLEAFVHYFNMYRIENHEVPEVPHEEFPDVDVFIATYNEPVELLYKTVNGCVHMKYPDKSKVHIYLCDDGGREKVRELARQMGVGYLDREDHEGAKAGNLNHALSVTNSPLIATFDADMIPKSDFLMVMVSYFVAQEIKNRELDEKDRVKIGFIQSPQSFYNPDLFQFNLFSEGRIPNEQDYFYKDVQITRNKSNSVIYGGSNTLISREALNEVGGFYTKSITEDFATGILIQKKGYQCFAINTVLASGLSPTTLRSLINQRVRWARGCIQTGRKMHIILSRHISFSQKANYLASIWYWYASWKRLIYIMSPILFATFGVMVVKCSLIEVLIFWLPMYISSNICLKMMSRNIRTTKWTNLYETVIFPFMLIPVLMETLGIRMKKFKVTKKGGDKEDEKNIFHAVPHVILIVLSVIGIVNCVRWTFDTGRIDYFVILFWLILNLYNLVMSLFFILGRKAVRDAERQSVAMECRVKTEYEEEMGTTIDISESGISVLLDHMMDIDEKEPVELTLDDGRYHAEITGQIVLVQNREEKWRYVFLVQDLRESKAEYMQLIYDRDPSLPMNLDESVSSFDDLRINVSKRLYTQNFQNRRRARIPIGGDYPTDMERNVHIIDYNYEYILVEAGKRTPAVFSIPLGDGLELECVLDKRLAEDKRLYKVNNYRKLHDDAVLHEKLKAWLCAHMHQKESVAGAPQVSLKRQRMQAADEFSEMDYL